MIYAVFVSIPQKFATIKDDVRKAIGREIADGNVLSFTEASYGGDYAFILLARSNRAAERVYNDFEKMPVHVKVVSIEGGE